MQNFNVFSTVCVGFSNFSSLLSRTFFLTDFFDLRARGSATGTFSSTFGTAEVRARRRRAASLAVHLGDDRVAHAFDFLQLVFELVDFGGLVTVQPRDDLLNLRFDRLLVFRI